MTAASPDQRAIYDWLGLVIARLDNNSNIAASSNEGAKTTSDTWPSALSTCFTKKNIGQNLWPMKMYNVILQHSKWHQNSDVFVSYHL